MRAAQPFGTGQQIFIVPAQRFIEMPNYGGTYFRLDNAVCRRPEYLPEGTIIVRVINLLQ